MPRTPLHEAAREGDAEEARRLLAGGAEVNAATRDGDTPLHWAADEGQAELVQLLLEAGADVNAADSDSDTPLMVAGGNDEVKQLLRQHGAKE